MYTGFCPSGPEVCTRHSHSHVCCRYLVWCSVLTQAPLLLQIPDSSVPLAPADNPISSSLSNPTLKVSLPVSQCVVSAPGLAQAPVASPAVASAAPSSPSLPGSRTSIPNYDLLPIDIDFTLSASQGAAAAVPPAGSPIVARFEPVHLPVSQDSRFSSVLLSPNRVHHGFDVTQEDQYPLFDTSPISDDHLSLVSPATSRGSSPVESFHSAGVSPATSVSLSIIEVNPVQIEVNPVAQSL